MKRNVNGMTYEMTPEEVETYKAEMERLNAEMQPPEPTEQERLRAAVGRWITAEEALDILTARA